MRVAISLSIFWGFVLSTGCQANPVEASISTPSLAPESFSTSLPVAPPYGDHQMTPIPPTPTGVAASQLVQQASKDLASRLGIPVDQISISTVQAVTWPDGSLGCPQPGIAYTQVMTPGYLILLESSGSRYPYHSDTGTQFILCQEELAPLLPVKPGEIQDGQPWMPP